MRIAAPLGALGILGVGNCLVPNQEHCAFAYGDGSCTGGDRGLCVVAKNRADHAAISNGCAEEVPAGFVHVAYGLPTRVEAVDAPNDPRSVQGVLVELGYAGECVDAGALEASFGSVVEGVAAVRRHLEERGRVRRAAVGPTREHVDALARFDEAIAAWVAECSMDATGTESIGTSTGETGSETETDSMGSSSTTGPIPCMGNEDCPDADAPLCGMTGECGTCEATEDPDAACAGLDPMSPVCLGGACVQCTAEAAEACTGLTPVCDEGSNLCVPCTAHDQCGEAACNLYTGECLPGDAVVHVGGMGSDFLIISDAVASFGEGAQGTIVVHGSNYNESATVGGGRVLAFLAADGDLPVWTRTSGRQLPQLTVNTGATVLLDGMHLAGNASSMVPALVVTGANSRAWLDRSRIVQNAGGGIRAETMAQLTLRNCFVGDGNNGANGLTVDGATADVLYTTLGAGFDNFEDVFPVFCSGAVDVSIRNSLLVSSDNPAELSCAMATVTYSASESLIPGTGNVGLGDVAADWFLDFAAGNFELDNPPPMLATTARWTIGDPPTDVDGDPRPTTNDTPDYAGADVP